MRVLHILSQTQLTGAEVYAAALADGSIARGHQVWIISDTWRVPTHAVVLQRPVHHARRGWQRLKQILYLRRFLRDNQIDVVHTHSRAGVRLAWWATRGTSVALVSTIHGRQHSSIGKRIFDTYGERVLAVCGALKSQMQAELGMRSSRIQILGNPVHPLSESDPGEPPTPNRWLMVCRWSGPKGQRAREFLTKIAPEFLADNPDLTLDLAGAFEESNVEARQVVESLLTRFPGRVKTLGHVIPLEVILPKYDLIIGGGRVAIAAVACARGCLAFGEALTLGLIDETRMTLAQHSNFGDTDLKVRDGALDLDLVRSDLNTWLSGQGPDAATRARLRQQILEHYGFWHILDEVLEVYRSARMIKAHRWPIPALMYHRVVQQPLESSHRIFITVDRFRKHLMILKWLGYQTLTFGDLLAFKNGQRPLSEFPRRPILLTFDDGYADNLEHAAPLLEKFGMKAVLFLLADQKLQYNSWDEGQAPHAPLLTPEARKKVASSSVFEIGSHGFRHRRLPQMSPGEALAELRDSKLAIERELQRPIHAFAFPYGDTNPQCSRLAAKAGYDYAVNTDRGGFHVEETPREIFRVNVFPEDGPFTLLKKASAWYRWRYYLTRGA